MILKKNKINGKKKKKKNFNCLLKKKFPPPPPPQKKKKKKTFYVFVFSMKILNSLNWKKNSFLYKLVRGGENLKSNNGFPQKNSFFHILHPADL